MQMVRGRLADGAQVVDASADAAGGSQLVRQMGQQVVCFQLVWQSLQQMVWAAGASGGATDGAADGATSAFFVLFSRRWRGPRRTGHV